MDDTGLGISTTRDGDVVTVAVSGEVDIANAAQLRDAGLLALEAGPGELVVDLTAVTFMDSAGLGHLVRVLRASRAAQVPVRMLVMHPAVLKLFHMTGLTSAFAVQQVA